MELLIPRWILKRKRLLLIILGVLIVLGFLFLRGGGEPVPTPIPTPLVLDTDTKNWSTAGFEDVGVSFKYPPGVKVQHLQDQIRLFYVGQEQEETLELIDGLSLSFSIRSLTGTAVLGEAQKEIQAINQSAAEKVLTSPQSIQISGLNGYWFSSQGLGEARYYFLAIDSERYLYVIDASVSSSTQDFESIVNNILSTLQID